MKSLSTGSLIAAFSCLSALILANPAEAVVVKSVKYVNDGKCFTKIQLRFENETDEDILVHHTRDSNVFRRDVITGDQEICDDDGGFTLLVLYRALQSRAALEISDLMSNPNSQETKKAVEGYLEVVKVKEWEVFKKPFFETATFFANPLRHYAPPRGLEASLRLTEILETFKSYEGREMTYAPLIEMGKFLEYYFKGKTPVLDLGYACNPAFPCVDSDGMPLYRYGINDLSFALWAPDNGTFLAHYTGKFVKVFRSFYPLPSAPTGMPSHGWETFLGSIDPDLRPHLDEKVLAFWMSKKDTASFAETRKRIGAMYDAFAVLMADKRCNLYSIKTIELGRARGMIREESQITINPEISDISFGTAFLEDQNGSDFTLKFSAGHFNIGTSLTNINGWLHGIGEVGNHVGFYQQLEEMSPSPCKF